MVDSHHTVEDVGIVLGQALKEALGDKAGINRYGTAFVPMDETLGMASLDLSGRSFLVFDASLIIQNWVILTQNWLKNFSKPWLSMFR